MTLHLAFQAPGSNPVSRMIAGFDPPNRFSHVALLFDQTLRFDAHIQYGVRFHDDLHSPQQWTLVDPGLLPGEVETVRKFCELQAGKGYDTAGVFAIAHVPFAKESPDKWFCSELACAALQSVEMFEGLTPHLLSPNGLYLACAGLVTTQGGSPA